METTIKHTCLELIALDPLSYYISLSLATVKSVGHLEDLSEEERQQYNNIYMIMYGLYEQLRPRLEETVQDDNT